MSPSALDPRFTFETFVVGTANRLAAAAARRVAESPGSSYNPLFIYSASGLGKTHLVTAVGHLVSRVHPDLSVEYSTLEQFMDDVTQAVEAGHRDAFRSRLAGIGLLILDDVQFLAGRHRTQEELMRAWDALSARGGQVVLASDRPPQEIDALDDRLVSRFSGGLIVDIGAPDYETRVAIILRKAESVGQGLVEGVPEAVARLSFTNVRELHGALNRIFAVQELEGRRIEAGEVMTLIGPARDSAARAGASDDDEFGAFVTDITGALEEVVTPSPAARQLAAAVAQWDGEGYRTRRLEQLLAEDPDVDAVESALRAFEADVDRLREIDGEIAALDPEAPERGRAEVLRDPDRVEEASALLGDVRERVMPFPEPPEGPELEELGLDPESFPLRVAFAVAERPGERYNPFFIHSADEARGAELLAATGRRMRRLHGERRVAFIDAPAFSTGLIRALEHNRAESWRQRFQRVGALFVAGVDHLAETERAQEELFHIFDVLHRSGVQLGFSSSRAPAELTGIEDRLRTRLASGLVVEIEDAVEDGSLAAAAAAVDPWFLSREKVTVDWPYLHDLLIEELS